MRSAEGGLHASGALGPVEAFGLEELEQAAPPAATNVAAELAELIRYTDVILYGSDDARRRLDGDPKFRGFKAAMAHRTKLKRQ